MNIDIIEEDWLNEYGKDVLERLLWDHSRPKYINKEGKECHHHIYWATDNYETNGSGFRFFDEIQIACITGQYRTLVRPRASKSKREQELRTREKAEVFTPAWVCNAQNNLIDEAWFGRADVFNTESHNLDGTHTWHTIDTPITFPTEQGKTWQDYVCDTRLEMACGEAPYLVSPYDTTTGEPISFKNRIGLLDRKMRIIAENVKTSENWIYWAKCALKNTYGFEWQGDNLLLAREALLKTIIDYYADFAITHNLSSQKLRFNTLQTMAYIISWNIFQMDGITKTLPMSGEHEQAYVESRQSSLFAPDNKTTKPHTQLNDIQKKKIFAKVADWHRDGEAKHGVITFKDIK